MSKKVIEDFKIVFGGPSKREKEILIKKCMHALEGNHDCDFYQATAAAGYVGRDERLVKPLIKAYKRRRGWKRWLVFKTIKYLKYDKEIL